MDFLFVCSSLGIKRYSVRHLAGTTSRKRSNVFRGEMFVSFYVGFLVESQPVVK